MDQAPLSDEQLLADVRQAIHLIATGHQSYSVEGVTYTRADLGELRRMESMLAQRVSLASGPAGGVRSYQVAF